MEAMKPVAIVGAGFAGLTAANFLKQNNIPFFLFEAGSKIAGLATTFRDPEGFSYDFGAHFITNRLAEAVGVSEACKVVKHYGEAVWLNEKSYSYPFGLVKIPRMAFEAFRGQFNYTLKKQEPQSAADWFRKRYGAAIANEIALPLIEAWSGVSATDLSPALAEGLFGGSILKTLFLKSAAKFTGRAVACGYNKEKPETPSVWHVYPNRGISTLCEKLAEGIQDSIKLDSPVSAIFIEKEKAVSVKVKGEIIEVSSVVSTAPVNVLANLVRGTTALKYLEKFRYRPMIFVNMRFAGTHLLPDTVLWFPEKKFPFFRLTEATISMPWLAPAGKTIITADIGCWRNDDIWNMSETELAQLCLENMQSVVPGVAEKFLGCSVLRTLVAYPVFLNSYDSERRNFADSSGIDNLLSIGRNGEFSHLFMEDIYWRTQAKVQALVAKLSESTVVFQSAKTAPVESNL